jgi:M6 family metalloprotease-like protein
LQSRPYNPYDGVGGISCTNPTLLSQDKNLLIPGGRYKPESTVAGKYPNTNSESVFRILIVFVQFDDDETYPDCLYWPPYQGPNYINNLLAEVKNNNYGSEWWNAYNENTETISDYFMESSRGNFHVVGECVNIILPHDSIYYQRDENKIEQLNSDLYVELLKQSIQWQDFDNWKFDYTANPQTFSYQQDNKIDMIYVVHRIWRDNIFGGLAGSIAKLFDSKQGQSHNLGNGYYIQSGTWVEGSGCTFTTGQGAKVPYAPFTKNSFLVVQTHELGHYLFGFGHQNYGVMMGNWLPDLLATGIDARLSPWETIYLGYGNPKVVNFNEQPYTVNYHLSDFSSRNENPEMQVIQVPIDNNDPNEFFLLANRTKVSSYDRIMGGDTAKNNFFRDINAEYGKGVYIYHKKGGYTWDEIEPYRNIDQECADGLFDWEFAEYFHPDWSNDQPLAYLKKISVSRANDWSYGALYNADEKSVRVLYQNNYWNCWGGKGKKHTCLNPPTNNNCNESTDRIYTNNEEIWTSRAWAGDRWDAWKKGYNEVFSPYSSPSTIQWSTSEADIFIWLYNQDENGVDFKIYKTGSGGYNLSSILEATPPSRPMGLKVDKTDCINGFRYPILTWNHNIEPDMLPESSTLKRYKIFRAFDALNTVPQNYTEIYEAAIDKDTPPSFTDLNVYGECNGIGQGDVNRIRYKIKAVDKTNLASVYSDFVATSSQYLNRGGDDGDGFVLNPEIPREFNLSQNYPNPFNPVAKINFALPKQGFVTLKIYDIIGREIKTLVNEVKQAGYYTVDFNGSSLASGVYFYRIQSGDFVSVKRMVLVK